MTTTSRSSDAPWCCRDSPARRRNALRLLRPTALAPVHVTLHAGLAQIASRLDGAEHGDGNIENRARQISDHGPNQIRAQRYVGQPQQIVEQSERYRGTQPQQQQHPPAFFIDGVLDRLERWMGGDPVLEGLAK